MYIQRWLYSTNAKDIAILYFIFAIFSGVIGSIMSLIIRLELAAPGNQILHGNHQLFNVLVVGHALLMIFFLVMPGLVGGFGKKQKIPLLINNFKLLNNQININDSKEVSNNINNNIKYLNDNKILGSYLAGLIEGDGTISIPKKRNPQISIVFNKKDKELANYLCNILECGNVYNLSKNTVNYQIQDIPSIYKILTLINGYLRTPKYYYYINCCEFINNYIIKNKNTNNIKIKNIINQINIIDIKPLDESNINENAWLSGITDADGNFSISLLNGIRKRVRPYYRLELKQSYQINNNNNNNNIYKNIIISNTEITKKGKDIINLNYFKIMSKIATYFNVELYSRNRELNLKNNNLNETKIYYTYIIIINNIDKNIKVIEYFNKYPLLSSKYLDYCKWKEIIEYTNIYSQSSESSYNLGLEIRKNYNNTRTIFNWDHLKNLK